MWMWGCRSGHEQMVAEIATDATSSPAALLSALGSHNFRNSHCCPPTCCHGYGEVRYGCPNAFGASVLLSLCSYPPPNLSTPFPLFVSPTQSAITCCQWI